MFLPDAQMDSCQTIGLDTHIHVLSDKTVKLEMYFMQYTKKERVSNKRFKLTLNPGDNHIEESIPQVEGAEYFKLSVDDLYGSSRSQAIATARQIAMYLCRERTNLSLPKIGQLFGGRDHTTVMYANRKIADLMKERRSIYNQVSELTSRIKQDQRVRR